VAGDKAEVQGKGLAEGKARAGAPSDHAYLASRLSARAGKMAGGGRIGMIGSVLATVGLSLLRKKGKAGAGAALLGTAAALAWLRREQD
jgi:membrane protein